jgi:hypothetical protein
LLPDPRLDGPVRGQIPDRRGGEDRSARDGDLQTGMRQSTGNARKPLARRNADDNEENGNAEREEHPGARPHRGSIPGTRRARGCKRQIEDYRGGPGTDRRGIARRVRRWRSGLGDPRLGCGPLPRCGPVSRRGREGPARALGRARWTRFVRRSRRRLLAGLRLRLRLRRRVGLGDRHRRDRIGLG